MTGPVAAAVPHAPSERVASIRNSGSLSSRALVRSGNASLSLITPSNAAARRRILLSESRSSIALSVGPAGFDLSANFSSDSIAPRRTPVSESLRDSRSAGTTLSASPENRPSSVAAVLLRDVQKLSRSRISASDDTSVRSRYSNSIPTTATAIKMIRSDEITRNFDLFIDAFFAVQIAGVKLPPIARSADKVGHGRSSGAFNFPWTASEAIRIFIDGDAVLFNP